MRNYFDTTIKRHKRSYGLCYILISGFLAAVTLSGCGKTQEIAVISLEECLESSAEIETESSVKAVRAEEEASVKNSKSQEAKAVEEQLESKGTICVYVCGAVERPGVVELPLGSRADDAVKAAGGMTQEADSAYVNLAAFVEDGEKLFIPTVTEAQELSQQQETEAQRLININTADAAALCTLPGIGESRAADILLYREEHGAFESIEDIMKVPGIKNNAFEKIRDKISVT